MTSIGPFSAQAMAVAIAALLGWLVVATQQRRARLASQHARLAAA